MSTEVLAPVEETKNELALEGSFGNIMEMSEMLAMSTIVPQTYQRKKENCFIALELANRMNVPVMMVMQNLYVVQGKPSWSGQAIATMLMNNKKYTDIELHYTDENITDPEKRKQHRMSDAWGAYVTATRVSSGKTVTGSAVTMGVAKAEGWSTKTGSKWKTMPQLMLGYRAYAWFARVYCPDLMMGVQTDDEVMDVSDEVVTEVVNPYEKGE